MFTIKQAVGVPPKATVLIVGGSPQNELSLIARTLCTMMNAHICSTHYVGDLSSLLEYEAIGHYKGEMISLVHASKHAYLRDSPRVHQFVFYITNPNLGIYGRVTPEEAEAHLTDHVYYLTLQTARDEVHMLHHTNRTVTDLCVKMMDIITDEWSRVITVPKKKGRRK